MKPAMLSVLLLIVAMPCKMAAAQSDPATHLFNAGQFEQAIAEWDKEVVAKPVAALFYNKGLAYSRLNKDVEAIYSFEQALRLKPCNKKIKDQLSQQRAAIEEPVIAVKPFFLQQWYYGFISFLRPGQWAFACLLLIMIGVVHVLCVFNIFPVKPYLNGRLLYIIMSIAMTCLLLSFLAHYQLARKNEAILVQRCDFHQGATTESPILRQLAAGEKVKLTDTIGSFYYVTLTNLDKGWIQKDCTRIIAMPRY